MYIVALVSGYSKSESVIHTYVYSFRLFKACFNVSDLPQASDFRGREIITILIFIYLKTRFLGT